MRAIWNNSQTVTVWLKYTGATGLRCSAGSGWKNTPFPSLDFNPAAIQTWIRINPGIWNFFSGFKGGLVLEPFTIPYELGLNHLSLKPLTVAWSGIPHKHKLYVKLQAMHTPYYTSEKLKLIKACMCHKCLAGPQLTRRKVLLWIFVGKQKQPKQRTILLFTTPSFFLLPLPFFSCRMSRRYLDR